MSEINSGAVAVVVGLFPPSFSCRSSSQPIKSGGRNAVKRSSSCFPNLVRFTDLNLPMSQTEALSRAQPCAQSMEAYGGGGGGVFLPDSAHGGELGQSRRHFMGITPPPRRLASSIRRRVGGMIGVIGCQNCVSHGCRRGSASSRLMMTRWRDEGRDLQHLSLIFAGSSLFGGSTSFPST